MTSEERRARGDGVWRMAWGWGAAAAGVLLLGAPGARAELPLPPQTGCGDNQSVANCPAELRNDDGSARGGAWSYISYIAPEYTKVRQAEEGIGSGSASTIAWQTTAGRFDVPIAILDCGIRWRSTDLANKIWLNTAELQLPRRADGTTCAGGDCDGNGLWTVSDYTNDARVSKAAGVEESDGILDGSDLIAVFSDGIDNDNNGYVDDIAGWDFMWDNNDPYTNNDFYHGSSVMEEAGAEGNNGGDIGHCPNCAILPIRISDSFVGEGNKIAAGIVYAVDRGAKVIGMALGSMTNSALLQDAMRYAWDHNVTIVAAAGDELGYHHNVPGANDYALYVHSIKYWPTIERENAQTFLGFFGCNNFGARLDLVGASDACATGSTAAISGIAGLVHSRAKELGITLSASEARQILIHGIDDVNVSGSQLDKSPYFPSKRGWDFFFGYGRSNAARAVALVTPRTIPPEVEIRTPTWFQYVDPRATPVVSITGRVAAPRSSSYRYEVAWAPGYEPDDEDYIRFGSGSNLSVPIEGALASLDLSTIPLSALDAAAPLPSTGFDDTFREKLDKVHAHALTIRVRVTDLDGNVGEMQRQIFLVEDPDLVSGFPKKISNSADSSPVLYDLDGDGTLDVILGTSGGYIHAWDGDGRALAGWPVKVGLFPAVANHQRSPAYATGEVDKKPAQGIVGPVAVGDLDDDGIPEVAAATLDGSLFVYEADGTLRPGFPVERDPVSDAATSPDVWYDPGMFSGPVLTDLDDDGFLEIVQAAMDQKLYVFREDGTRQDGFPVVLESPDYPDSKAGRVVSGPAIGDIDGNGDLEIVVGTNEYINGEQWWGLAYAVHGDGDRSGDPIVRGWPVEVIGAMNGVIMYIGEGVTSSPGLVDVDGDGADEIILSGVAGKAQLYRGDGRLFHKLRSTVMDPGKDSGADTSFWTIVSNPAIGDIDGNGQPDVSVVGSGLDYFIALGLSVKMPYAHMVNAWNPATGRALDAFPRFLEDISFFLAPAIADISGDGNPEVIVGTSGYVVHAFDKNGEEPEGWPKQTGGWLIASPAVGDIDGDGAVEVVTCTREGYVFAWHTSGSDNQPYEWPSFRHDPQNTGNYGSLADRGI